MKEDEKTQKRPQTALEALTRSAERADTETQAREPEIASEQPLPQPVRRELTMLEAARENIHLTVEIECDGGKCKGRQYWRVVQGNAYSIRKVLDAQGYELHTEDSVSLLLCRECAPQLSLSEKRAIAQKKSK